MAPHLLKLPDEMIALIMRYVGAEFFKQDLRRLTICKHWYGLALEESRSTVSLTDQECQYLLGRFVTDPSLGLPSWAQTRIQSLEIQLDDTMLGDPAHGRERACRGLARHALIGGLFRADNTTAADTKYHPVYLLNQLGRLQELTLDISNRKRASAFECAPCEQAVFWAFSRFGRMSMPFLRRLDLTLVGGDVFVGQLAHRWGASLPFLQAQGIRSLHACVVISKILRGMKGLKVAYLALEYVCTRCFAVIDDVGALALETLSVRCRSADSMRDGPLQRCRRYNPAVNTHPPPTPRDSIRLAKELGAAVRNLAAHSMEAAKSMRVVWPIPALGNGAASTPKTPEASQSMYAWDCLAGEARTLPAGAPWDGEGEAVDLDADLRRREAEMREANDRAARNGLAP